MSLSVNKGNERSLCNVSVCECVSVCMCVCMCMCVHMCVSVNMSSFVCLRVYVKDSAERKFETEEGRKAVNGRERKQSTRRAVSVPFLRPVCRCSCVFIVMFSSWNSAPFLITSACVPTAPVVFVQPKCAWSNHLLTCLYIYFISDSSMFLLLSFYTFYLCPAVKLISTPQLSYALCKGLGLDIMLDVTAGFKHLQKFYITVFYKKKKHLCDCTDLSFCRFVTVVLHPFGKKNILHDPTVFPELLYIPFVNTLWLYSTVPNYYWQLHGTVCLSRTTHTLTHLQTQKTHTYTVPDNQSNIVRKWSKCTLNGLVLSTCVLCTVFPLPCDNASAKKEFFELLCRRAVSEFFLFFYICIEKLVSFKQAVFFYLKDW